MESSKTSLASRTHFEVLGLGLEASSPRKLACPRLENSTIFWIVKILWSAWKIFWKTFFCGDRLKNFCEDLFFFLEIAYKFLWGPFFLESTHACVLGPWPRECLSSERLSLALASDFFCVLGLEPCVLDSTFASYLCYICRLKLRIYLTFHLFVTSFCSYLLRANLADWTLFYYSDKKSNHYIILY